MWKRQMFVDGCGVKRLWGNGNASGCFAVLRRSEAGWELWRREEEGKWEVDGD